MAQLDLDAPIYVAGHRGMVGSALVRALREGGTPTWCCAPPRNWTCAISKPSLPS